MALFPALIFLVLDSKKFLEREWLSYGSNKPPKQQWERLPDYVRNELADDTRTTNDKFRKLYNLTCAALNKPGLDALSSFVSIDYSSLGTSLTKSGYMGFKRVPDPDSYPNSGTKRNHESDQRNPGTNRSKKQVRGSKQKDISSLLGDFT
jgi:hypothetical protein